MTACDTCSHGLSESEAGEFGLSCRIGGACAAPETAGSLVSATWRRLGQGGDGKREVALAREIM